ncbi:MAG: HAD-IA family hydrolase [Pseudomonadota bacterium]
MSATVDGAAAVFDLDGTLVDTAADLIEGANRRLSALGLSGRLDPVADAGIAGRGGKAMLRLGYERSSVSFAEADVDAAWPGFIEDYEAVIARESRFFPGALDAVEALRAAGWRIAICTNKPERLARRLLDALGEAERFQALIGADTLPVRKPDPAPFHAAVRDAGGAPGRGVMIGDTVTDRRTAAAAGAPCVLMDLGTSADDLRSVGAEAVLRDYAELPATLTALAGGGSGP